MGNDKKDEIKETKQSQEIKWVDDWCEPVGDCPPITKEDLETKEPQCHSMTLQKDL